MNTIKDTPALLSHFAQCGTSAAGRLWEATWRATRQGLDESLNLTQQLGRVRNPVEAIGLGVMGLQSASRVSTQYVRDVAATGARFLTDVSTVTEASEKIPRFDQGPEEPRRRPDGQKGAPAGDGASVAQGETAGRGLALEVKEGDSTTHIDPAEVVAWAQRLNVSRQELRTAIGRVGPVLSDVKRFLAGDPSPVRKAPGHREERADDIRAAAELEEDRNGAQSR